MGGLVKRKKPIGVGRPKGSGKGRTDAYLVRLTSEELQRVQRQAARAKQAASQRTRLALAREEVLEAVRSLSGAEKAKRELLWVATQNLRAGDRDRWLPGALRGLEQENTKPALDRVREAVKWLAEIEAEIDVDR
jgi:hypothetical protein